MARQRMHRWTEPTPTPSRFADDARPLRGDVAAWIVAELERLEEHDRATFERTVGLYRR